MHRIWFRLSTAAVMMCLFSATAMAQLSDYDDDNISEHEWIVSGQIGSAFGASAEEATAGFTGTLTYLRAGAIGAEVLGGITPDVDLSLAPTAESAVGSFMVNGIAALLLGADGRWQAFARWSRGDDDHQRIPGRRQRRLAGCDDTQLGGIGFGLMAFSDRWGLRTDLRYFTGFGGDEDGLDAIDSNDFLSDVDFWRANVGVAYRW